MSDATREIDAMRRQNGLLLAAVNEAICAIRTQGGLVSYHSVILDRIVQMRDAALAALDADADAGAGKGAG